MSPGSRRPARTASRRPTAGSKATMSATFPGSTAPRSGDPEDLGRLPGHAPDRPPRGSWPALLPHPVAQGVARVARVAEHVDVGAGIVGAQDGRRSLTRSASSSLVARGRLRNRVCRSSSQRQVEHQVERVHAALLAPRSARGSPQVAVVLRLLHRGPPEVALDVAVEEVGLVATGIRLGCAARARHSGSANALAITSGSRPRTSLNAGHPAPLVGVLEAHLGRDEAGARLRPHVAARGGPPVKHRHGRPRTAEEAGNDRAPGDPHAVLLGEPAMSSIS